jgi:hypothetical protein
LKLHKCSQLFIRTDNEPLSVVRCASATKIVRPAQLASKATLEQPEEFKDNNNNDNHSDYVKDASVHAGDSYQSECAVTSVIQAKWLPEFFTDADENGRSLVASPPLNGFSSNFWDARVTRMVCLVKDLVPKFPFVHQLPASPA